jgi:hypothetical protein
MAITATQRNEVISLLVGMFDAAPSATLMTLFVKEIEAGKSVTQLANDMAATTEFQSLYPTWLTDSEFAASFAETILDGHTSGADLAVAVSILEDILAGGATRGEAAEIAASFLSTVDVADPAFGEAGQAFQNKTDVATYFATNLLNASSDMASLQAVVANIDETQASVDAQKALIDLGVTSTDDFDQMLTIGQDNITGTAGDDMFAAWIFDNQNSAQSGDVINGGLGFDTLMAEIGNSQNFAISLKTTSVEAAYFRAQAASSDSADNDIDDSDVDDGLDQDQQIDAQDMSGTEQFWSTSSRANLTIEDIQRNSHETTIGWQNSDSGDVSYEVYFDNITAPGTTTAGSQLFLELLDLEGMRTTNSASPLLDNPYSGFAFTLDGVQYLVEGDEALSGADATFEQLKDGFNALLAELGLTTVTAALGSSFSAINSSNGVAYTGTTIVLTNSGPEILGAVGWIVDGVLPPDSNIHTSIDDEPPATSTTLTQTDIVFDYVGSGSKSGTFIAGEISQGLNSGSQGIQQFNIVVDRSSNMDEIRSTNNSLEEVYVESMGANGTLKIDNIDDVRVFDASAMQNSVILGAQIGMLDDVAGKSLYDKYVDLTDTQANDTLDNIEFEYTLTGSADVLTMVVSEEAASYDDFELLINSGAGNDVVTLYVNSDDAVVLDAQWAADQEALDNIVIVTGAGDDTVNKFGGGSATIATGSGNDTVYSDNSGTDDERATWLFNAANTDINDILGQGAGTSRFIGEDVTLTVSFSAGNVTGGGVTGGPADAVGFDDNLQLAEVFTNGFESTVTVATTNYLANSATIVQAIKNAINNDATLSKFLLAEDGPNHSLKVTSLVDGVFDADDLAVNINNSVSSAGDLTGWDTAWELYNADSSLTLTQANLDAQVNLLAAQGNGFDSDSVLATDGASIVAATTTQGVLEVLEEQTFDFTGVGVVANGDTITITVNGNAVTYTAAGGDGANTAAMLADFAAGDIASQNWGGRRSDSDRHSDRY